MIGALIAALALSAPAPDVFDDRVLHTIRIRLTASDRARLDAEDLPWVPASVTIDGESVPVARVRRKRQTVTEAGSPKTSLTLKLGDAEGRGRFRGLRRLVLNAERTDPTMMREKLAYDLFRDAGCPAPRAAFAEVSVSVRGKRSELFGLYTMVEHVGKPFLDQRFGGHEGNLYKWRGASDLFDPGRDNASRVPLRTNEKKSDRTRLLAFVRAISDPSSDLSAWVDVESYLRCLAVEVAVVNLDGYSGTGNNLYLYDDPRTNRFVLIPWDLDLSFGQLQLGSPGEVLDWDIWAPAVDDKRLIARLLAVPSYREIYAGALAKLVDGPFSRERIALETRRFLRLIRAAAARDRNKPWPTPLLESGVAGDLPVSVEQRTHVRQVTFGLLPFVERRARSIREQLSGTKKGAVLSRARLIEASRPRQPIE